jgi:hypothetical protein
MAETGVDYPVTYVESGLHASPEAMRRRIQAEIDSIANAGTILLGFGYCGNSLVGVSAPRSRMVLPRVDDCISLFLGSHQLRRDISAEQGTYFLTNGWLEHESNLLAEHRRCVQRYGQSKALRIMKTVLKNYRRLMFVNTGAYRMDEHVSRVQEFAGQMDLRLETVSGSLRYFKKLLQGPWDDEFIIVQPGEAFRLDFGTGGGQTASRNYLVKGGSGFSG